MIKIDLSIEALLARRELAEKATPGPWEKDGDDIYTEWSREEYPERGYEAEVECFSEIRVATTENYSPDISDDETAGNAAHIAANSPDVVIATIDELLRLREENARLKEGLENALHVNELRLAEIAKTLITGLAEGITGDSKSVTSQIRATCVHCNASFTSAEEATAHDNVCPKHPANIRAGRLEEALENLLRFAECQICRHESTHRGGNIWTICDDCGAKWADDEGGKPEFKEPKEIVNASKALAAARRAVEE